MSFYSCCSKILLLTSFTMLVFNIVYSQHLDLNGLLNGATPLLGGLTKGDPIETLACMQKMMPCKQFFSSPPPPPPPSPSPTPLPPPPSPTPLPPPTCCDPLKEMITKDVKCLCDFLNNDELLMKYNVTHDMALNLPKACGATFDLNVCKNYEAPPKAAPAAIPSTPSATKSTTPDDSSSSSESSTDDSSKKSIAVSRMSPFGGSPFGFFACFLTLYVVAALF